MIPRVLRCCLPPHSCPNVATHVLTILDGDGQVKTAWLRCQRHLPAPRSNVRIETVDAGLSLTGTQS